MWLMLRVYVCSFPCQLPAPQVEIGRNEWCAWVTSVLLGIRGNREREQGRIFEALALSDGGKQAYMICLLALAVGAFTRGFATGNSAELIQAC